MRQTTVRQQDRQLTPLVYALGFVAISLMMQLPLDSGFWKQLRFLVCICGYAALIFVWAESVQRRVIDPRVRRQLISVAASMLLLLLLRSISWRMPEGYIKRYLWYAYYIPMLAIPTLFYWVSQYVASREYEPPPGRYRLTAIPSVVLLMLVMTNEAHHWVFHIGPVELVGNEYYSYGYAYYALLAWVFCLILLSIWTLYRKASRSAARHRLRQPMTVVGISLLYCVMYATGSYGAGPQFIRKIELLAAICAMTTSIWESCICSGLLPNNMDYGWCFDHSTLNAQIVDETGAWVYHSEHAKPLAPELFARLRTESVVRDGDAREIAMLPVSGGYSAWERDIRDISSMMVELEDVRSSVAEVTDALQVQLQVQEARNRIQMQDQLRNRVTKKLDRQLAMLSALLDEAEELPLEALLPQMKQVTLLGTYIKRCSNLMLLQPEAEASAGRELELCIHESFENLKRCGADTGLLVRGLPQMSLPEAVLCYDVTEAILEGRMDDLQSVSAILQQTDGTVQLMVQAHGMGTFIPPQEEIEALGASLLQEDEEDGLTVILRLRNRGAEP